MLGPLAPAAGGAGRRDEDGVRTAVIVRADDGSVGLSFLRSGGASAGPFEVTRLVPQSAAERSRAVEVGDHFRAVDGRDVTALDDAAVAGLFRGAPGTTLKLLLCDGPPLQPQPGPLDDKEVAAAVQWARSRKLPAPTMSDFEALLRLLQPMAIPLAEVTQGQVIGQGANGCVMKAKLRGNHIAIKHVNPNAPKPLPQLFREMLLELRVTVEVSQSRHPNIVGFQGAAVKFPASNQQGGEWQIGLVFELCDPYDLYHLLHNHKIKLKLEQKLQLARESASGLAYLHSLNILHRDFGSRNLLIKDGHAKVTDFGLARKMQAGETWYLPSTLCGTLQWMAPEQISGKALCAQSDVFALGTVVWEILSEIVPLSDLIDPLSQDMPKIRDALNTRDVSTGGWPFGFSEVKGGSSSAVSHTLLAPRHPRPDEVPKEVKDYLDRIVFLMHQHLPVFRPSADEVEEVLKSVEKRIGQESLMQRLARGGTLLTSWQALSGPEILQGLEERVTLADKVARFYLQHDRSQVSYLSEHTNNERWNKILNNSSAWQEETKKIYKASIKLPVSRAASASSRVMRRRQRLEKAHTVVADTSTSSTPRALVQLLQGITGATSWLIGLQQRRRVVEIGQAALRTLFASPLLAALGRSRLPEWLTLAGDEAPSGAKQLVPHTEPSAQSPSSEAPPTRKQATKQSSPAAEALLTPRHERNPFSPAGRSSNTHPLVPHQLTAPLTPPLHAGVGQGHGGVSGMGGSPWGYGGMGGQFGHMGMQGRPIVTTGT